MDKAARKEHWENIYQNKRIDEVSWYQEVPVTSLDIIEKLKLPSTARVIDIGAGDSYLPDNLIKAGFANISVLDISANAIKRSRNRLGAMASNVNFIVSDITDFNPEQQYDLWHDRAVLHFLNSDAEVASYVSALKQSVTKGGYVVIGVFSDTGPTKCSGIGVRQYGDESMRNLLGEQFVCLEIFRQDHHTPFGTSQNFIFGIFERR